MRHNRPWNMGNNNNFPVNNTFASSNTFSDTCNWNGNRGNFNYRPPGPPPEFLQAQPPAPPIRHDFGQNNRQRFVNQNRSNGISYQHPTSFSSQHTPFNGSRHPQGGFDSNRRGFGSCGRGMKRSFGQNQGPTMKQKKQKVDKRDLPENNKFVCEPCDRGYKNEEAYKLHCDGHEKCKEKGCSYVASPKLVTLHYQWQHKTGLAKKIWQLESKEDIEKWRNERKKNFPTKENIEKKKKEIEDRIARGEVIETRQFGKMSGQGRNGHRNGRRGRGRGRGGHQGQVKNFLQEANAEHKDDGSGTEGQGIIENKRNRRRRNRKRNRKNSNIETGEIKEVNDNSMKKEDVAEREYSVKSTDDVDMVENKVIKQEDIAESGCKQNELIPIAETVTVKDTKIIGREEKIQLNSEQVTVKKENTSDSDSSSSSSGDDSGDDDVEITAVKEAIRQENVDPLSVIVIGDDTSDEEESSSLGKYEEDCSNLSGVGGALGALASMYGGDSASGSEDNDQDDTIKVPNDCSKHYGSSGPFNIMESNQTKIVSKDIGGITHTIKVVSNPSCSPICTNEAKTMKAATNDDHCQVKMTEETVENIEETPVRRVNIKNEKLDDKIEIKTEKLNDVKTVEVRRKVNNDLGESNVQSNIYDKTVVDVGKESGKKGSSPNKKGIAVENKRTAFKPRGNVSHKRLTLLQKLLAPDIRHERNVVMQCIRHIVSKDFFGIRQLKNNNHSDIISQEKNRHRKQEVNDELWEGEEIS